MCLTCGARARSVVMTEMSRTQHGRSATAVRTGGSEVEARKPGVIRGAAGAGAVRGCHEMLVESLEVEMNWQGNNNPQWSAFRSAVIWG